VIAAVALWIAPLGLGLFGQLAPAEVLDERALENEFDAAVRLRRAGEPARAAAAFERLAAEHPRSRTASRALTSAAELYEWQLGQIDRASALYDRVLAGRDNAPGVMPALRQRLDIERRRGGPLSELRLIHLLRERSPDASFAPYLLLRSGEVLFRDLSRLEEALLPLELMLRSAPRSTRVPEALMLAASIERALHRPEAALERYRAIVARRESSFIIGEYDSARVDDAYFALAETLERDLHRPTEAAEAYRRLVTEVPESVLVRKASRRAAALSGR
jgi:tetratricopeptide (TPR) repeat protein